MLPIPNVRPSTCGRASIKKSQREVRFRYLRTHYIYLHVSCCHSTPVSPMSSSPAQLPTLLFRWCEYGTSRQASRRKRFYLSRSSSPVYTLTTARPHASACGVRRARHMFPGAMWNSFRDIQESRVHSSGSWICSQATAPVEGPSLENSTAWDPISTGHRSYGPPPVHRTCTSEGGCLSRIDSVLPRRCHGV